MLTDTGDVHLNRSVQQGSDVTTTVASDPCCYRDQTYRSLYSVTIPDRRRKASRNPGWERAKAGRTEPEKEDSTRADKVRQEAV